MPKNAINEIIEFGEALRLEADNSDIDVYVATEKLISRIAIDYKVTIQTAKLRIKELELRGYIRPRAKGSHWIIKSS